MNMDIVAVAKTDLIQSLFDIFLEKNITLDFQKALDTFYPSFKMDCSTLLDWGLPNMEYDPECKPGKSVFPINLQLSLPPQQRIVVAVEDDKISIQGDLRLHAFRTDTNKALMDFVMEGFNWTISTYCNSNTDAHIRWDHDHRFKSVKMMQRGQTVKFATDVYKMSNVMDHYLGTVREWFEGRQFRYMGFSTFRNAGLKIDGASKAIYFGLQPDPIFFGKY